jgi:hypothetical protein
MKLTREQAKQRLSERLKIKREIEYVEAPPRYGIIDFQFRNLNTTRINALRKRARQ